MAGRAVRSDAKTALESPRMSKRSAVVVAIALVMVAPAVASACSCVSIELPRDFEDADAVVLVRARGRASQGLRPGPGELTRTAYLRNVVVLKSWKGPARGEALSLLMSAEAKRTDGFSKIFYPFCIPPWQKGREYLVFANRDEEFDSGRLTTHQCSVVGKEDARSLIESLEKASGGPAGSFQRQADARPREGLE
jgi:hypothetical protein